MDRANEPLRPIVSTGGLASGRVLSNIEVASHRSLFNYFQQIRSDDNSLYAAAFDILLGVYCNTLTLVRFLELGLSVACVCTKFPELNYVNEGTIQFEVQQPMIARDGPHPVDQPVHNYMVKRIDRRSLSAAFSIAAEALGLISGSLMDGTRIASQVRVRAIQQLARNVQTVLDSFERGTADQLLNVLLEKAVPLAVLFPLSLYREDTRLSGQVMRSALLSDIKRRIREDTFFLSKHELANKDLVLGKIADLVNCTAPSVAVPKMTHADSQGRPVDGVIVTTAGVRQRVLSLAALADTEASVPVTYGEMMISGGNLVTALTMGKALNGLDDVARHLLGLDDREMPPTDPQVAGPDAPPATARVKADLIAVGDRLVFLEALEKRVYHATRVPYPLVGTLDVTFVMPVGLYKPAVDRFSRHPGSYAPAPGHPDPRTLPPQSIFFHNRDGVLTSISFQSAVGTLCHPSLLDVGAALAALRRPGRELPCLFGAYVADARTAPLIDQVRNFLDGWHGLMQTRPRWVTEGLLSFEQFVSPANADLELELHPAFDFFAALADVPLPGPAAPPQVMATIEASLRVVNGNLPIPLCSVDFRDSRGFELSIDRHRLGLGTVAAVRGAFQDANYPVVFYLIEAVIHGSERTFCALARLVMQCIRGYWHNTHNAAFVNNFYMVMYINTYLGSGELPEECSAVYKDLVDHAHALRRLVTEFTLAGTPVGEQTHEELNNVLLDPALLPPLIWDCDPLIFHDQVDPARRATVRVNGGRYAARARVELAEANFRNVGHHLVHNQAVRGDAPGGVVPHHGAEWAVLSKIYYFAMVPAFARGQCCTMGVHYDRVYPLIQTVVVPDVPPDQEAPSSVDDPRHPLNPRNLVPNSLNVLFHNARVTVDTDALLILQEAMPNMAERTSAVVATAGPDAGMATAATQHMRTYDAALHHGLLMMAYQANDETLLDGTFFYPAPVNPLFACADHLAALPGVGPRVLAAGREAPPVPHFMGANYLSTIRYPVACHAAQSRADENTLTYALMGGYFKMSPVAYAHQLRTGFHPGVALTVVRQDRFSTENMLFAEKASESYFVGQLRVDKHDAAGAVNFTLTQPRAHVDLGVGYTATYATPALRAPLTDLGNLAQNLYMARGDPPLLNPEADAFLRGVVNTGNRIRAQGPLPFFGQIMPPAPAGTVHGQASVCEFVVTPVSADLNYFRLACNPRGRSASVLYAGEGDADPANLMFDHTQGDPAYPHRATNNPWASQRHSYADRLYNGQYNMSGTSPIYSPCFKFFTPSEVESKGRCVAQLVAEAGTAVSRSTTATEVQFKRPPGARELVEDPCGMFQEAYPPLCASDAALLRTRPTGDAETHFAQYLIRDASPLKGCLPVM
ncbi:major capsid protein [Beluga whale alphaherpesvirus 1]|uniref:Major capsid protein n=1 Tax=Beluga whale alphaherpesvirus 1 TaxID=1434720 RepID=A0A286MM62_9ALPH|nr:major capsid protein [Beluga whale alphaherpesvirus 1]ASW27088.1 major capsid protein [Beluga whale alphaherpesvirus 1]